MVAAMRRAAWHLPYSKMFGGPKGTARFFFIITVALTAGQRALWGQDASAIRLLNRVKTLYAQHRDAISSIEFHYTFEFQNYRREVGFARSSDKAYFASIARFAGAQPGMPDEMAWDGGRAYSRMFNTMVQSSKRSYIEYSCPLPEDGVGLYVNDAIGLGPGSAKYTFVDARAVQADGYDGIELEFLVPQIDARLVTRHSRAAGYWPVGVKLFKASGAVTYELNSVSYAAVESAGNHLYYPEVVIATTSAADGIHRNTTTWALHPQTLKVNHSIPHSRFVLIPWPSETVMDRDTTKSTRPQDITWSPVGKVGFPWDIHAPLVEEKRAEIVAAKAANQGSVANAGIAVAAGNTRATPGERRWGLLVPIGCITLVIAGYAFYRQRRGTT